MGPYFRLPGKFRDPPSTAGATIFWWSATGTSSNAAPGTMPNPKPATTRDWSKTFRHRRRAMGTGRSSPICLPCSRRSRNPRRLTSNCGLAWSRLENYRHSWTSASSRAGTRARAGWGDIAWATAYRSSSRQCRRGQRGGASSRCWSCSCRYCSTWWGRTPVGTSSATLPSTSSSST